VRGALSGIGSLTLDQLHAPITMPALLAQSLVAIVIVGGLSLLLWKVGGVQSDRIPRMFLGWSLACLVAAVLAIGPTRAQAEKERARFGLDTVAARSAGPLIDQRGLVSDELAWLEATGRNSAAADTRAELERINARLAELGVE